MPFSAVPYDAPTVDLMTAALEASWVAAQLGIAGLSHHDRAKMEMAILNAVGHGQRDFKLLQQAAFDALEENTLLPVERRHHPKVIELDRRRR